MKKGNRFLPLVLVIALIISIIPVGGCKKEGADEENLIVTVDNSKIYLDEMMYYILQVEAKGQAMNEMYESAFGKSYWDEEYEEGVTYREMLKTDTLDMAVMYEIFFDKAAGKGYVLSEKDKKMNESNTEALFDSMTDRQKAITRLTREKVLNMQAKLALGRLYYNDLMKSVPIDEKKIREGIVYDDYRQYDIEYIYTPTAENKDNGTIKYFPKTKKKKAYDKIRKLLKTAKSGKEFSKIVNGKDEDLQTADVSFVKGDKTMEEKLEKAAVKLKTGEVSGIISSNYGYYIVKMLNNSSSESYDAAVKEAVNSAKVNAFGEAYKMIKKDYTITVNGKVWDKIVINDDLVKTEKLNEDY